MCDWFGGFGSVDLLVDWQMNESPAAQHEPQIIHEEMPWTI